MRRSANKFVLLCLISLVFACVPAAPLLIIAPEFRDAHVGNAGCLIKADDKLVVVRHRFSGKLGLPAGTAEPGESAQQTAHRETWEETGLDVSIGRLLLAQRSFFLYECHATDQSLFSAGIVQPAPPDWFEITEALLVDPRSLLPSEWRLPKELNKIQNIFMSSN